MKLVYCQCTLSMRIFNLLALIAYRIDLEAATHSILLSIFPCPGFQYNNFHLALALILVHPYDQGHSTCGFLFPHSAHRPHLSGLQAILLRAGKEQQPARWSPCSIDFKPFQKERLSQSRAAKSISEPFRFLKVWISCFVFCTSQVVEVD